MTPQTKRFTGEAVILILYLIYDVVEVWPQHHFLSVLSFVVGVSAIFFMEFPTGPWIKSTCVLAIFGFLIYIFAPPSIEPTITHESAAQRAWLALTPRLPKEIKNDASFTIDLVIDNSGKEPATGVNHRGISMMIDMPASLDYAPDLRSQQFAEIIAKQCEMAVPLEGPATIHPGQKPAISIRWDDPNSIPDLINNKKILVMYGCMGYTTAGSQHYTTYCLYLTRNKKTGEWQIFNAPIGNKAT